jgi:hypothetical protein
MARALGDAESLEELGRGFFETAVIEAIAVGIEIVEGFFRRDGVGHGEAAALALTRLHAHSISVAVRQDREFRRSANVTRKPLLGHGVIQIRS